MKVIKTEKEHEAALAQIDALLDRNPEAGTPEAEELEVLSLLVEEYERGAVPLSMPDPIEAIKFRMEQQDLRQRDIVPYLGSRSKVSEVLARKRPLTLSMIRAVHKGLGIPAEVLLQERDSALIEESGIEWGLFPIREMVARGWIASPPIKLRDQAEELLRTFFEPIGGVAACAALYKKTDHVRSCRQMDRFALAAWAARVLTQAREQPADGEYVPGSVTYEFMREVACLSWSETGPKLAQEFLGRHGITLIVEPHLTHTHLDGAALFSKPLSAPVIGLTIRHDRIDNYWFCLMHELAHVSKHLDESSNVFYDDLDVQTTDDSKEREADRLAGEALIPSDEWESSPASVVYSPEAVHHLAEKLRIHTAIVAGRIRHKTRQFKVLSNMVGQGQVRRLFPEVSW